VGRGNFPVRLGTHLFIRNRDRSKEQGMPEREYQTETRNAPQKGALSTSESEIGDAKNIAGAPVGDQKPKSERFAAVPYRAIEAFAEFEMSRDEFALLVWIIGHVNPHNGKYVRHLSRLKEDIAPDKSRDTVRRWLSNLRDGEWLDFKAPGPGQHKPYIIWLNRAKLELLEELQHNLSTTYA
jgi:hypothetical protein